MVIVANADILGAITARLRTFSEVTALTSTRIAGEIGPDWFSGKQARYAIRLRRTGGVPDPEEWRVGIHTSRIDCNCYGSSERAANLLLSTVLACLCPDMSRPMAFTQQLGSAFVHVASVMPEVDVVADRETDTGYRYAWVPLSIRWQSIAS